MITLSQKGGRKEFPQAPKGLNLMNLYPIVGHCTKNTYMYALGPKYLPVAHPNFPIILWLNSMIGNFNVHSINPHQKY